MVQNNIFPPLGECMYCGGRDGLSDEHIIPYALSGTLVLPKSSCSRCAAITSDFEMKVLRGFMYDARVVGNFPSRRKNSRPKNLNAKIINTDGSFSEKEVDASEMVAFLNLPIFSPANILHGKPRASGVSIMGIETLHFGKDLKNFAHENRASGLQTNKDLEATEFAQLLAKIAYGYLVATTGLFPKEETPLLRIIKGEADDACNWIGSANYHLEIEKKNPLHAMDIVSISNQKGEAGFIVRVKLFANSGCTGYEIAARVPGWQNYVLQQDG